METRANYVTIGSFVLLVLAAGFMFIWWLHANSSNADRVPLEVRFPGAVTGLATGAAVYFNGIRIGQVSKLSFAGDGSTEVVATADIDPSAPLKRDVKATLGFQGLTGLAFIQLTGGSPGAPPLLAGDGKTPVVIADRSAFEDLLEGARDILKKADTTLTSIEGLVTENAGKVSSTIGNIEQFSDALAQNSDSVRTLFSDVGQAAKTIADLSDRLQTIVGQAEAIIAEVPPEKVGQMVDDATSFTGSLRGAGKQVDAVMADVAAASEKLNEFMSSLDGTLASVRHLVDSVPVETIDRILKSTDTLLAGLAQREPDISSFIVSAKDAAANINVIAAEFADRKDDINAVITDVRTFSTQMNELATGLKPAVADLGRILAAVDSTKIETIVTNVETVSNGIAAHQDDISAFIVSAKDAAADIDSLVGDFAARKDDIDAIITDVRTFAGQANELVVGLKPAVGDLGRILAAVDSQQIEAIVRNVDTVTGRLAAKTDAIDGTIDDIRSAAATTKDFVDDIAKNKGAVDAAITDGQQMMARLNDASAQVKGILDEVDKMLKGDGQGLIVEATRAAKAIRIIAEDFQPKAAAIANGLARFSTTGLSDLSGAIDQARLTLISIQNAVNALDRDPSRVIFGGTGQPTYSPQRR